MTAPRFRPYPGESGIGGFLLLFVIGQIVSLVFLAVETRQTLGAVRESWAYGATVPFMRPTIAVEMLMNFVRLVGTPLGLVLLFRKSAGTPTFYRIFLGMVIVWAAVDTLLTTQLYAAISAQLRTIGASTDGVAAQRSAGLTSHVRVAGSALIWLLYWSTSERVRLTFARRDASAASPARR